MAIDRMMLDPTLDTYRKMLKDLQEQNITGEDMDKMAEIIARMEQLGNELSDINDFFGKVMQEDLFGKFSAHYTKALTSQYQAQNSENGGTYNDVALLKQCVDALKYAVTTIKDSYNKTIEDAKNFDAKEHKDKSIEYFEETTGTTVGKFFKKQAKKDLDKTLKEKPNAFDNSIEVAVLHDPELIIKGIQDLIDLGEQEGMTTPKFLRLQIETGLDKAMQGTSTFRKALEFQLDSTLANPTPWTLKLAEEKLRVFDELAAKNKFNIPNLKELELAHNDIDYIYERDIKIWDEIIERWKDLLGDLDVWSLSHCSFAPSIEPWRMARDPKQATIKTQKTTPGIFKQKEKLLKKYFGLNFMDVFTHPSFEWDVKYNYIEYSQEFTEFLIEKVYPQCVPLNSLNSDIINERASFYPTGSNPDRETNPHCNMYAKRLRDFYDSKFGKGRYDSKFGVINEINSAAKPWDWDSFKFKNKI